MPESKKAALATSKPATGKGPAKAPAKKPATPKRRKVVLGPDGKVIRLPGGKPANLYRDLPLVAYELSCSHMGKQLGIRKGEFIFCEDCQSDKRVKRILAQ